MKRLLLLFSLCAISRNLSTQTLIRVHPAAGEGDFASLQEAVDSAMAGDIIYVYPGSYGSITVDKGVHIYGPGFDVLANTITGVKTVAANTIVNSLTLQAGADGATVKGLLINGIARVSNITGGEITGNWITTELELNNASSILVQGNYLLVHNSNYGHMDLNSSPNAIIRNNIFRWIAMDSFSSASFKNNIIITGNNEFFNSEIKNNIFYYNNTTTPNPIAVNSANEIQYNVFCTNVGYANNLTGQDRSTLFLQADIHSSYTLDANLQLSPTSPAIGAGENGADCGIFGGGMPYKFSGIPELPLIYELNAPDNAAGSLDVTIKVRGEN